MYEMAPESSCLKVISSLQHKRRHGSSRHAAERGRAKTKVLFHELAHQAASPGGESSRASSCSAEEKEESALEGGLASAPSSASFKASVRPPGPPFQPAPTPPPRLPKGITPVCLTTVAPVRRARRALAHGSPSRKPPVAHTPSASPSKKPAIALQIPTQAPVSNTGQAKEADQLEFDNLVPLPKDALTSGILSSWVVLYNPKGLSESQLSQPKAFAEPPPSSVAPRSFMFKYFAEQVDKIPDE
ncbi:hypothetical protein PC9H_003005 [Pleurotus ostreatus]|uniref:Uncharacterized protein n=1 Tax=Pleurotus ostreatus TaxID=5322 RepID=A0A8H7A027_PLEOS|nr:uncharacterized protein PC9H_003005 [Pleurotus ostreatus]KAF7436179.1 hypothetical protein PC9H_003005 [Pleurotus ostreatus]